MSFKLSSFRSAAIVLSLAAMTALPACAQQEQTATPTSTPQLFSSSATSVPDDATANELPSLSLAQHIGPNADASPQYGGGYGGPGPRRPYGRPTYRDRYTNPDGSSKFAFEAGVGPVTAAGSTGHYSRTGVGVSVGVGRNFSRAFGVLLQYNYDHMGVTNSAANNFVCGNPQNCNAATIDFPNGTTETGATHLWSLTVNPVINFSDSHSQWGMYVVGGGGFYRKMTVFNITDNFSGGSVSCTGSGNGCRFSNNAFGVNGGLGFFYKITADSNAKVFAEARYVWVDNQPSVNNTIANGGFPQTNQRTGYFPVTVGLRF
jgi:Outer membrane protein beta-barrel domain